MDTEFDDALAALEAVLDKAPADTARLRAALELLPRANGRESAATLARIWRAGCRILHIEASGPEVALDPQIAPADHETIVRLARNRLESTLFDLPTVVRGAMPGPEAAPAGTAAVDEARARALVVPYLACAELALADTPTGHLRLLWNVGAAGREPFRTVVMAWADDLEARGVGEPGTPAAVTEAGRLVRAAAARAFDAEQDLERALELLDHRHPLLAWAAATWIGRFSYHARRKDDIPPLEVVLARIAGRERHRAVVGAAYALARACMFEPGSPAYPDPNPPRLPLASIADDLGDDPAIDLDDWVLTLLEDGTPEPWVPFGVPFARLVAEHYEESPAFAMRLLEAGHGALALECATRRDEALPGMGAVLQRIAGQADRLLASAAAQQFAHRYTPDGAPLRKGFSAILDRLEAGIDAGDYDAILDAFLALKIPAEPTADELSRAYEACYRILCIGTVPPLVLAHDPKGERHGHLAWIARDTVERTLYDAHAERRARVREFRERAIARGRKPTRYEDESLLPAELTIPFTPEEAGEMLAPFLDALARQASLQPTAHIALLWLVWQDGYPACRAALSAWLDRLEADGVGEEGTRDALDVAIGLHEEVEAMRDEIATAPGAAEAAARVRPLLDHPHRLVATLAHKFAGALYRHLLRDDAAAEAAAMPPLRAFVSALRERTAHKAPAAGAFVDGFSESSAGLSELQCDERMEGFDFDSFVVDVLAGSDEPHLPGAQAFWFYVHEAYADRPDVAHRLIDVGDLFTAFMCATEIDPPAPGMADVLRRIAAGDDAALAARARDVLREIAEP